jgi:hypothetical protein
VTKIRLGDVVRDKITGLTGVAISRTEHLFSARQIEIQPRNLKTDDGSMVATVWLEESRCELATVTDEDLRRQIL